MSYGNFPRINPPFTTPTINPNLQPRAPTIPNLTLPRTGIQLLNPNVARSLLGNNNQPAANLGNDLRPTEIHYQTPNVYYQQPDVYYPPQTQIQPQVIVNSELPSWILPLGLIAIGGIVLYALVKR